LFYLLLLSLFNIVIVLLTTIVLSTATVFIQYCYCSINNYCPVIFCYCLYSILLLFYQQPLSHLLPLSLFNIAIVPSTTIVLSTATVSIQYCYCSTNCYCLQFNQSSNPSSNTVYILPLPYTSLSSLSFSLHYNHNHNHNSTSVLSFLLFKKIIKMSMPQIFFDFCDNEKQLDIIGRDIFDKANDKFNCNWPKTTRGYRKALWAVIGDNPPLKLVPKDNVDDLDKCEFKL
jgi:hypothetical protein